MPETVIVDTSVLILLSKIKKLKLLEKVYGKIYVTPDIAKEYEEDLPEWIVTLEVPDPKYQDFLETQLDPGEASVIALSQKFQNHLLILDDLKARKLAGKLGLKYTGTLGVIHKAKQTGIIRKVKPVLDKLLKHHFYISEEIIEEFLKLNNE